MVKENIYNCHFIDDITKAQSVETYPLLKVNPTGSVGIQNHDSYSADITPCFSLFLQRTPAQTELSD